MEKKKRTIAITGGSHGVDEVCTFQVHSRRRVQGRLKPIRSKSLSLENVSLDGGIKIIRLGIEIFEAARANGGTIIKDGRRIVRLGIDAFRVARE